MKVGKTVFVEPCTTERLANCSHLGICWVSPTRSATVQNIAFCDEGGVEGNTGGSNCHKQLLYRDNGNKMETIML